MSAILLSLMLLGAAAQVQTRETPTTRLFVQTTPAGATIKLDGKAEGTAPKVFLVPPDANKMTVEVELEGHASQRREVVIQGGRVTRIEFQLAPQQAKSPAGSPSGFHNAPDDAQLAAKDPSGPRTRSLAEAVRVFNARAAEDSIGKSQSPLTEDEVIAAIRWSLLEIDKLAVSDKTIQALRGIIDSRELPPRFELEVLTVFEPNDQMEVTEWSVRLRIPAEPHGSTCIGIREQMVGSRLFGDEERNVIAKWQEKWRKDGIILLGFDREYEDERAKAAEIDRSRKTPDGEHTAAAPAPGVVSLAEAVRVFNARAAENSIGKSQSPLTEDEVIAAIRWSLLDTKKLPVSDKTLQSLKSIPDFRELPSGFDVEVMTCFQPDSQTAFTKWSVRLRIPAEPRSTTDIVIRDQMIAARFSDATAKTEPLNRQQPEAEFSRARELFEKGYVSESEYDKAKHDWNQTPAAAVRRFFDAVRQGDGRAVEAMMTSRAQQQFQQTGALAPVANATASYELGDVRARRQRERPGQGALDRHRSRDTGAPNPNDLPRAEGRGRLAGPRDNLLLRRGPAPGCVGPRGPAGPHAQAVWTSRMCRGACAGQGCSKRCDGREGGPTEDASRHTASSTGGGRGTLPLGQRGARVRPAPRRKNSSTSNFD